MEFTNRKFGVEIEMKPTGITLSMIAQAIRDQGIEASAESYNHTTRPYWKVITDASCGYEVVSPILSGQDGLDQITKVCAALNSINAQVDKSCGLHVHVDARDLTKEQIAKVTVTYARYEKFFDLMNPESRREDRNTYCRSMTRLLNLNETGQKNFTRQPIAIFDQMFSRYQKVNLEAYSRHGSIEFRQHCGTTNSTKINNWVVLMVGFVEKAITGKMSFQKITICTQRICEYLSLRPTDSNPVIADCAKYVYSRFHELNPTIGYTQRY